MTDNIINKVIVIGSGSAGLTACIYLARSLLNPICISGYNKLGLLMTTSTVENFPGFPDGIQGPELMTNMFEQAKKFGTEFIEEEVISIDTNKRPFKIKLSNNIELLSESVIIATGSKPMYLNLDNEKKLIGRGISTCATCDGFFFRDEEIVVIGGGNSALEESIFLTKFASKITIIHRRNEFKASKIILEHAKSNPKIKFMTPYIAKDWITEKDNLIGLVIQNVASGELKGIKCSGAFIFIGHKPNTEFLNNQLETDQNGYIIKKNNTMTSIPGVFVAGDVTDTIYKQAITASAEGCKTAIDCEKWLNII